MNPDQFNIRHLAAMAAVVELGSVSLAARAVNLTQPAVTQGIAKLEAQLGLPLFARQPGGMVALEPAERLKPRIDAALRLIGSNRVTAAQVRAFVALARGGQETLLVHRLALAESGTRPNGEDGTGTRTTHGVARRRQVGRDGRGSVERR